MRLDTKGLSLVLASMMVISLSTGIVFFITDTSEATVVVDPTIMWTHGLGSVAVYTIMADSQGHVHILMHDMESSYYATNKEGSPSSFNIRGLGHLGFGSFVLDSQDRVHISYVNTPSETYWITEIHYATDSGGSWSDEIVDKGDVWLGDNSIAVDTHNHVHIAYTAFTAYPSYNMSDNVLKYATFRGGMWANETLAQNVSSYSISTDTQDHVYICYLNNNGDLRIAYSKDGYSWSTQTIVTGDVQGMWNPIAVDSQDVVHIGYLSTNGDLKYVNNHGGSWNVRTIAAGIVYNTFQMVVSKQGYAHIIYWQSGGDLMYTTNSGGSWSTQTIVDNVGVDGAFLALDSQNHAHVNYGDIDSINTSRYATNMDGSWSHETVIEKEYDPDEIGGGCLVVDTLGGVHYLTGGHTMYYVAFTPTVLSAPGSPTALTANPGNNQVQLSWTAPTNDGGSEITGYRLYWSLNPNGTFASIEVSGASYLHEGIENGRTYYYKVSAVNAEGEGDKTEAVSATPLATIQLPSSPTNLIASVNNGNVSLTWTAPTDGSQISSYKIYRGTSPATIGLLTSISGTSFLDTNVMSDQTYYYQVSAVNTAGEGERSVDVNVTVPANNLPVSEPTASFIDTIEGQVAIAGLGIVTVGAVSYTLWRRRRL